MILGVSALPCLLDYSLDRPQNELALATVHFQQYQFQEAQDILKRRLLEERHRVALNVAVALTYYYLDYYDVSLEILAVYSAQYPSSVTATNLKVRKYSNFPPR